MVYQFFLSESCFWCCIKKVITKPKSSGFSSILSSRRFVVLYFTFRSTSLPPLLLHVNVLLFQHHLLKILCFPIELPLFLVKDQRLFIWVNFWTFCSVPLMYLSILLLRPHFLDHYSFILCLKSGSVKSLVFIFLNIVLAILGPLPFI